MTINPIKLGIHYPCSRPVNTGVKNETRFHETWTRVSFLTPMNTALEQGLPTELNPDANPNSTNHIFHTFAQAIRLSPPEIYVQQTASKFEDLNDFLCFEGDK